MSPEDYDRLNAHKWYLESGNYAARGIWENGKVRIVRMHKEVVDCPAGLYVDHINRDKLDNRRENLRAVDCKGNSVNSPKRGAAVYKGVYQKAPGKWVARIHSCGKFEHLGVYYSPEDAAHAYDNRALELWGEVAYINLPNELHAPAPARIEFNAGHYLRRFDEEEAQMLLAMWCMGVSVYALAKEHGVAQNTISATIGRAREARANRP